LKNENSVVSELPVRKDFMRSLSPMRCIISPTFLLSKKRSGSRISFAKKSEISEMLMRVLTCKLTQLCRKFTAVCVQNKINCAIKTRVTKLRLFVAMPLSTMLCVRNGKISDKMLPIINARKSCTIWLLNGRKYLKKKEIFFSVFSSENSFV
jgi:hypothetical protein